MANAKWNTSAVLRAQEARMESILDLCADVVVAEIKPRTPVRTGFLRGGTAWKKIGKLARKIFNDVEYAVYVEFGTRFMPPQSFIRTGVAAAKPKIERLLKKL